MDARMESAHVKHGSPSPPVSSCSARHRMSSSASSLAPSSTAYFSSTSRHAAPPPSSEELSRFATAAAVSEAVVAGAPMGNGAPHHHQHQHGPPSVIAPHHHSHHMMGHHPVVAMPPTRPPRATAYGVVAAAAAPPVHHAPHNPHHHHTHQHYRRHPHSQHAAMSVAHHPHHHRAHPHIYAHHNPHHHHIAHAHATHHAAYHAPQQHGGSSSAKASRSSTLNKPAATADVNMQQPTSTQHHASPPEQQSHRHNGPHIPHHPYADYPRHTAASSNHPAPPKATSGYHRPMPLQPVAHNVVQQKPAQNKQTHQQQQPTKVVQSRSSPSPNEKQQRQAQTPAMVSAKPTPFKPSIPSPTVSAPIPAVAVEELIKSDLASSQPADPVEPCASLASEAVAEINGTLSVLHQVVMPNSETACMDNMEASTTMLSVAKAQRAAAAAWTMKSPVTQCFERMLGAAKYLSQYPTPEIFKRQEQEAELSKKRTAEMMLKVKTEDCEDDAATFAKRSKAASKKSSTMEDAVKLDPSNPFFEVFHDEELHQKVVLQMALINDGKEVNKKQDNSEPVSSVIGEGFYWRDYPVLEEILYDNMANYYSMSAQNRQSRHQQEFNNALVDSVRYSAVETGLSFDPAFTDKRLRDRIRCFYKTHLQNAKKRLATLQKHPNSAIHQYNLRIYIRCVKENISVEDSQRLESSSARDGQNVNGGPSMVQPMSFLTGPPIVVLRSKTPKEEEADQQGAQLEAESW